MLLVEGLHGWFFFLLQLFLFIRDIFLVILLTVCKVNKFEFYSLGSGPPPLGSTHVHVKWILKITFFNFRQRKGFMESKSLTQFVCIDSKRWNIFLLTKELTDIPLYIDINIYHLSYRCLKHQSFKYTHIVKTVIHKPYYISKKNCKYKNTISFNSDNWKFKSSVDYKRKRWKNVKFKDFCEINTSEHWKGKHCRAYSFNYKVGWWWRVLSSLLVPIF